MRGGGGLQAQPEVLILDRIAAGGFPAATDPVRQPLPDAFLHVLGVGNQHHLARGLQRFQRHDRAHQFHAVVGGVALAAGKFAFGARVPEQCAPTAVAGIAEAGAVGVDQYYFHGGGHAGAPSFARRSGVVLGIIRGLPGAHAGPQA